MLYKTTYLIIVTIYPTENKSNICAHLHHLTAKNHRSLAIMGELKGMGRETF